VARRNVKSGRTTLVSSVYVSFIQQQARGAKVDRGAEGAEEGGVYPRKFFKSFIKNGVHTCIAYTFTFISINLQLITTVR